MPPAGNNDQPGITITGSGRAGEAPDVFVVVLAAEAISPSAAVAMREAGEALSRMRTAALEHGVRPEQLSMQNMSLRQNYDQSRPGGLVCELVLAIRSGDVGRAGELVSACVEAGGDQARLQGTSFEHSDPTALLIAARKAAFADALARASELAVLAKRKLGVVLRITEGEPAWSPPGRARAMSVESAPPVDAGSVNAAVTLTVTWAWA
jgi:uncharacterized protein YggE